MSLAGSTGRPVITSSRSAIGPCSDGPVPAVQEQAGVTKQTAGYLVDQLERAGYVRRVPDPTDGRARLVQIAGRGVAAREVARVTEAEVEAEWTAFLGPRAAEQLRRALTRLRAITDPYLDDDTAPRLRQARGELRLRAVERRLRCRGRHRRGANSPSSSGDAVPDEPPVT